MSAATLTARKKFKHAGRLLEPGESFVPATPELAQQLVDHRFAYRSDQDPTVRSPGSGRGGRRTTKTDE